MVVRERQAAVDVDVRRGDARRAEVELRRDDRLAHRMDVARSDLDPAVGVRLVDEQVELLGELAVEVIAHEAEIVFFGADPARRFETLLVDDPFPHREAEMIGIDRERQRAPGRKRPHDVRMRLDRRHVQIRAAGIGLAQQSRVPVRRPSLVHDLAGEHRIEIERLLAHREEHVALPAFELRAVVRDEPEQIVFGLRRDRVRVASAVAAGASLAGQRLGSGAGTDRRSCRRRRRGTPAG